VQLWSLHEPLENFLENSKKLSDQNFTDFKSSPVSVNEMDGFFWDYSVVTSNGEAFKGNEVFLVKNGVMYRISFFVPEKSWNDKYSDIFWDIVNSFKVL
jgi:hypothetical protein